MNTEEFIDKAREVHGDKYDYSKVEYTGTYNKVSIICPIHGEFLISPNSHLCGGGCSKCSKYKNRYTTETWIKKAREVHGDKYDYSKVKYKSSKEKVIIICPEHGEFKIAPDNHNHGQGCPKCRYLKSSMANRKKIDTFIEQSIKIHSNKYDYSKIEYKNNKTKVCIICPEHGEFWQTPDNHLRGKGCPKCSQSKLEEQTRNFLERNNIKFEEQKSFKWLINKLPMRLDFYLPDYNIAIECQGIQHFKSFDHFGGDKGLNYNIEKDRIKNILCEKNGVKLLYYSNEKYNSLLDKKIYHNLENLLKENVF